MAEKHSKSKQEKKCKKEEKISKMINKDRFKRISDWRKTQKERQEKEMAKTQKEKQEKREKIERERLRKEQIKQRREESKKIKDEARKLKEDHERRRKQIEREMELKDKLFGRKKTRKTVEKAIVSASENDEVDPLDSFMQKLEVKEIKPKEKSRAKTTLSKNLQKHAAKMNPRHKKAARLERSEILDNDTRYEAGDLVVKQEVSWLDKMRQKKKEIKPVDHDNMNYEEFRKDFYIEAPEITSMTAKEVADYRADKLEGVKIRGKDCPRPIFKWSQCGLPGKIYDVLRHYEYQEPFPIQCQAMPCIMKGRDVIACAKTGSGKTLAFILPMFRHIQDQPPLGPEDGPVGLIVSPTRELAKQTAIETIKFSKTMGMRVVCCHGGVTVAEQIADLKRGAEIIVATPGRMIDMLSVNSGKVTNLRRMTYLVLDEADRMFDMGFEPQIMAILANSRPERQTVLFSATFPRQVEGLVKQIMRRPVEIVIGGRNVASNSIVQSVKVLEEYEKFNALLKVLGENYYKGQILVFTDRQEAVDSLFTDLQRAGYFTLTLHGGMNQSDRDSMVSDFKNKTRNILVATSLAARGLDVKDLNLVVNYTVPNHYEDYVHRVGRTGRAGSVGKAVTFITPGEEKFAPELLRALTLAKQQNIPSKLREMAENFRGKVERGEEKYAAGVRSSGKKGFKFDETEEYQQKLGKQRQEAVYGGSVNKDMADQDELMKQNAELVEGTGLTKLGKRRKKERIMTALDKQLAAAKAGAAAIKTTINVAKQTHCAEDVQALAQVAFASAYVDTQNSETKSSMRSKAEAVAKSLSISQKLCSLGAGATPQRLAEAINQRQFSRRFVVNDYPQAARIYVTSRKAAQQVAEFSDVKLTTRGIHFMPGRSPASGEEKLCVFIEGKTPSDVERAYKDLKQMAEETAVSCAGTQQGYGKYQVV